MIYSIYQDWRHWIAVCFKWLDEMRSDPLLCVGECASSVVSWSPDSADMSSVSLSSGMPWLSWCVGGSLWEQDWFWHHQLLSTITHKTKWNLITLNTQEELDRQATWSNDMYIFKKHFSHFQNKTCQQSWICSILWLPQSWRMERDPSQRTETLWLLPEEWGRPVCQLMLMQTRKCQSRLHNFNNFSK